MSYLLELLMGVTGMPSCRDIAERMTGELEDGLSPKDRRRAKMHLLLCGDCRCHRRQLKLVQRTLAKVGSEPVPHAVKAELREVFRRRRGA